MNKTARTTANHLKAIWTDLSPSQHSVMVAMLLITGISMGLTFRPHLSSLIPFVPLMVLLMLSSAVMLISSMRGYAGLGTAFKILSLLLLGFILTYDNAPPRPTNSVEGKITLTGKVIMAEYMRGDRQRIRLAVLDDNDWPVDKEFDLRLITKKGETSLTPGDVVSGNARINSPLPQLLPRGFDFTAHAYHQGYAATGFLENITIRGHTKAGLASSLRFSIQHNLRQNLNEDNAAIASAVLVGLRSGITPEIREAFRASGLSHLLAISGLHMALFWGSIMALIRTGLALFPHVASRYPSLKLAALLSMPFGVFYLIISGLPISAVRAFLMLALFMLAILLTRRGITLHHVALAAIAILVLDPEQLTQPAFQMSFAAVFALVAGWTAFSLRMKEPSLLQQMTPTLIKYLGGIMIGSMLAGLATTPFVLHHFGVTTIWSILANLLGMPLMAFVIMPFGALALIVMPLGLEEPFLFIMGLGISVLISLAELVATLPYSRIAVVPPSSFSLYFFTLGLVFFVLMKGRSKLIAVFTILLAMVIWSSQLRPIAAMTLLHQRPLAALSDGHTVYISRKSANNFERSIITHPFGLSSQAYLGDAPSNAQKNFDLIIRQDNTRIAVIWRHHQLDDACAGADLVLVMSPMNVRSCQAVTIGLHNIRAHGGVLVIRDQDMFMLDYVDGFRQQFRAR